MNVAIIYSRATIGVHTRAAGQRRTTLIPRASAFNLVGQPETAVRESKERVRAAIG